MDDKRLQEVKRTLEEQRGPTTPQYISGTTCQSDVAYLLRRVEELEAHSEEWKKRVRQAEAEHSKVYEMTKQRGWEIARLRERNKLLESQLYAKDNRMAEVREGGE